MNKNYKIAHHLHIPNQLIDAVKNKKPGIVIIRNPIDAVTSLLSRNYYPSAKLALKHYCKFYSSLLPYKEKLLIAEFNDITKNFVQIVKRINKKYGTNFKHSDEMAAIALENLKNENKDNEYQALPNEEREQLKFIAIKKVAKLNSSYYYNKALTIYSEFIDNKYV